MKYLCSVHSDIEAEDIASQFEDSGIPIIQTNVGAYGAIKGAKMKIDLWVGIDSQYQEALSLLNNPNHVVINPVNVEEFNNQLEEFKRAPLFSSDKFLTILFGLIFASFCGWVMWSIVST